MGRFGYEEPAMSRSARLLVRSLRTNLSRPVSNLRQHEGEVLAESRVRLKAGEVSHPAVLYPLDEISSVRNASRSCSPYRDVLRATGDKGRLGWFGWSP
jgi:hypothetical protein